jgi:glycosyltransferase involved in cell wall biosynthesis
MIRVLYVIDKMGTGGAQRHVSELVRKLDRSVFAPGLCCLISGGVFADEISAEGFPVEVLGLQKIYGGRALVGGMRFMRLVRRGRYDIVHCYLVSSNIFGTIFGSLAGAPHIITTRRDEGFSRNFSLGIVERLSVNPFVDRVVTVSQGIGRATSRELFLSPRRVVAIPNGIDLRRLAPSVDRTAMLESLGLPADSIVVGTLGRLEKVKGLDVLIRASARVMAEAPAVRLVIAGEGPEEGDLRALAASLGIGDKTSILGLRQDVANLLSAFDVYVCTSHTEGMSNSVLEAMACGCPVVATGVGGNLEIVAAGETGSFVQPGDVEATALAVLDLVRDAPRRRRLGDSGRARVEREYDVMVMTRRYQDLYHELAGR